MKAYVLDANALVRYFRNEPGVRKIQELMIQSDKGLTRLRMSVVNLAEVYYVSTRYFSPGEVKKAVQRIAVLVGFDSPDADQSMSAAELRRLYKLGLADCFAAELAIRSNATLVSADPEFGRMGKRLKLLMLPKHLP